jgi:hypothetical protein
MQTDAATAQVERLLSELCVKLGFSEPLRHLLAAAIAWSG